MMLLKNKQTEKMGLINLEESMKAANQRKKKKKELTFQNANRLFKRR